MASYRSDITVVVQGVDDLRKLNAALSTFEKNVDLAAAAAARATGAFTNLATATNQAAANVNTMTRAQASQIASLLQTTNLILRSTAYQQSLTQSVQKTGQAAQQMGFDFDKALIRLAEYRTIGIIFGNTEKAIRSATQAWTEYDVQSRRTTRITGPQDYNVVRPSLFMAGSAYNSTPENSGEAYYQLATFITNANERVRVFDDTMKYLVATEGDARESTRSMVSIFEQFHDQLPKNISDAENMRRIYEAMGMSFKNAHLEANELANSMRYLGPIAQAANIPLSNAMALISTLTYFGQRSRMSGTGAAQMISRILTQYDSKSGGVVQDDKVYSYGGGIPRTSSGQVDFTALIRQLKSVHESLSGNKDAQLAWEKAVAGSQNSWRVLASMVTNSGMKMYMQQLVSITEALDGKTNVVGKMAEERLNTFADQFGRAWKSIINDIAGGLDDIAKRIGLLGKLREMGNAGEDKARLDVDWSARLYGGNPASREQARLTLLRAVLSQMRGASPNQALSVPRLMDDLAFSPTARKWFEEHVTTVGPTFNKGVTPESVLSAIRSHQSVLNGMQSVLPALPGTDSLKIKPFTGKAIKDKSDGGSGSDRAAIDAARDALAVAQARAEAYVRDHGGIIDVSTSPEARDIANNLTSAQQRLQRLEKDAGGAERYRLGLTPGADFLEKIDDTSKRNRRDRLREQQSMAYSDYQAALAKYGPFSDITESAAARATRVQYGLAQAEEDNQTLYELNRKRTGATAELNDARREKLGDLRSGGVNFVQWLGEGFAKVRERRVESIVSNADIGVRDLERISRPHAYGYNELADKERIITGSISEYTQALSAIQGLAKADATGKFKDQIQNLEEKIKDATKALQDLNDQGLEATFKSLIGVTQYSTQERLFDLEMNTYASSQPGANIRNMKRRRNVLQDQYFDLFNQAAAGNPEALRVMETLDHDIRRLDHDIVDEARQRYDEVRSGYRSTLTGGLENWMMGQGSIGDIFRSIGDQIIKTSLDTILKPLVDPFARALTDTQLAIQGNIDALNANTQTLGGTPTRATSGGATGSNAGAAGAIAAGIAGGIAASASGGSDSKGSMGHAKFPLGKNMSKWNAGDFATAGSAAYSIYNQGAEHGVTLGGVIGGAMTGYALGGPVGAAVGGALNLFGGLFGHKSAPTMDQRTPAFYNAPSDFNYYAYRYRVTGTPQPVSGNNVFSLGNTPIVNVYVDGSKATVTKVINQQTSTGRASQTSAYLDLRRPI